MDGIVRRAPRACLKESLVEAANPPDAGARKVYQRSRASGSTCYAAPTAPAKAARTRAVPHESRPALPRAAPHSEVLARHRFATRHKLRRHPLEHHAPTVMPRTRPKIHDPVRMRHDRLMVLDHDHRLPPSTSRSSNPSSCSTSARCRPLVGSSNTSTSPASPMCVASFSRWRSPPESVVSGWPSLR